MTFEQLDVSVALTVMLITHAGLFTLTVLWFRKDLAVCTKKMFIPNVVLFILGNLWPLTWIVYLIFACGDWITGRIRMGRIQALVDENNRLEKELADLQTQLQALKEEEDSNLIVRSGSCQVDEDRAIDADEMVKMLAWFKEFKNNPTPLPPYTPDIWKAIRELEYRLNGTESYIKHRDHLEKLY